MSKKANRNFKFNKNHQSQYNRYGIKKKDDVKRDTNNNKERKKEAKKKSKKSNIRAFWRYEPDQQIFEDFGPHSQGCKLLELAQPGNFDPNKVDKLINPEIFKTKTERLLDKISNHFRFSSSNDLDNFKSLKLISKKKKNILKKDGKKFILSSEEIILYEKWIYNNELEIKKDLNQLELNGVHAETTTMEGETRKLLIFLKIAIDNEDFNNVYKIRNMFNSVNYNLTKNLKNENKFLINKMNLILEKLGKKKIEIQMTTQSHCCPPLDEKKMHKLEDFQERTVRNINNRISTIVSAPTSSGKTCLMEYLYQKEKINDKENKVLVIVPRDPLAWQIVASVTKITGKETALVTERWKSNPDPKELIKKIRNSRVTVGTPEALKNILAFNYDNNNEKLYFTFVVCDEIHMIGDSLCYHMEIILQAFSDSTLLALSATIGNIDKLKNWLVKIGHENIDVVQCNKRFIPQQKEVYISANDSMITLHPLSLVSYDKFVDRSILLMNLAPTVNDAWDLSMKIKKYYNFEKLDPFKYFDEWERISLDDSEKFFNDMIKFLCEKANAEENNIAMGLVNILNDYSFDHIEEEKTNIYNLAVKLRDTDKLPAIFFNNNPNAVLRMVREFASQVQRLEDEANPNKMKEILKENKKIRKYNKANNEKGIVVNKEEKYNKTNNKKKKSKTKRIKIDELNARSQLKELKRGNLDFVVKDEISFQKPDDNFIFNKKQVFNDEEVKEWVKKFSQGKKNNYFPMNGIHYHYVINLLWRGIGVYVAGLPEDYLRLVQKLASLKKLQIIFSDTELTFGVSMPIRTSVLIRDPYSKDTLNSMLSNQMFGRSGRRGLDRKSFNITAGFKGSRIAELLVSPIPDVEGSVTWNYALENCISLSNDNRWNNIKKNLLINECEDNPDDSNNNTSNEKTKDFYEYVNYKNNQSFNIEEEDYGWEFSLNRGWQFDNLLWNIGDTIDCQKIALLVDYIENKFRGIGISESEQVLFSHLLLKFICQKKKNSSYTLPMFSDVYNYELNEEVKNLNTIFDKLDLNDEETIDINNIDGLVFECIRQNRLIMEGDFYSLRDDIQKFYKYLCHIQHYFFDKNIIPIARTFAKLNTRIWWILYKSSPMYYHLDEDYLTMLKEYEEESESEEESEEEYGEEDEEYEEYEHDPLLPDTDLV